MSPTVNRLSLVSKPIFTGGSSRLAYTKADYGSFRIGLFGLEKWHNVDRTVAQLAGALDHLGLTAKPSTQGQMATA